MAYRFFAWDGYFKTRDFKHHQVVYKQKTKALKAVAEWLAANEPRGKDGYARLEKTTDPSPYDNAVWKPKNGTWDLEKTPITWKI